jgi:aspartyl aminopeptidase
MIKHVVSLSVVSSLDFRANAASEQQSSARKLRVRQILRIMSDLDASAIREESAAQFAASFIDYMNESCTSFHAIAATCKLLSAAGFECLHEHSKWELSVGSKYYFTRNETSVIAFTVGGAYIPGNGFTILGAHSDSPCLKIKAVTCHKKGDALMLNTQPYGGGLWHTWFDRDLGIAGRIITEEQGVMRTKLVRIDRPIARIPNLAIHLTSGSERDSFAPNLQEHAKAILSMDPTFIEKKPSGDDASKNARLHPGLLHLVSTESEIDPDIIADMELQLIDVQPSTLGGATNDLIFSGRLDNLCSSYQIMRALIDGSTEGLESQPNIRMAMMFDHEEVGSASCCGAGSSMFMDTLRLISDSFTDQSHGNSTMGAALHIL